jgi:hypothetical protein
MKKIKAIKQLTENINRQTAQIKKARRAGSLDTGVMEQKLQKHKVLRGALLHIWPGGVRQ